MKRKAKLLKNCETNFKSAGIIISLIAKLFVVFDHLNCLKWLLVSVCSSQSCTRLTAIVGIVAVVVAARDVALLVMLSIVPSLQSQCNSQATKTQTKRT